MARGLLSQWVHSSSSQLLMKCEVDSGHWWILCGPGFRRVQRVCLEIKIFSNVKSGLRLGKDSKSVNFWLRSDELLFLFLVLIHCSRIVCLTLKLSEVFWSTCCQPEDTTQDLTQILHFLGSCGCWFIHLWNKPNEKNASRSCWKYDLR